jgi:hypothetical protein
LSQVRYRTELLVTDLLQGSGNVMNSETPSSTGLVNISLLCICLCGTHKAAWFII